MYVETIIYYWVDQDWTASGKEDHNVSYVNMQGFFYMTSNNTKIWTTDLSDSAWNNGLWSELLLCFNVPFFKEETLKK